MISGNSNIRTNKIDKERREFQLIPLNFNKYSIKIGLKLDEIFKNLQNSRQNLKINKFCQQLKFEGGGGGGRTVVSHLSLFTFKLIIIITLSLLLQLLLLKTQIVPIVSTKGLILKGAGTKTISTTAKQILSISSLLLQQSSERNVRSICQKETNILVLTQENFAAIIIALIFTTTTSTTTTTTTAAASSSTGIHQQSVSINSVKICPDNSFKSVLYNIEINYIIMQIFKIKFGLPLIGWRVKPEPGD